MFVARLFSLLGTVEDRALEGNGIEVAELSFLGELVERATD